MKIAKRAWDMRLVNCEAAVVSYKKYSNIFPNARCGAMCIPAPNAFYRYKPISNSQMHSSNYVP